MISVAFHDPTARLPENVESTYGHSKARELLDGLFAASAESESLMATRYSTRVGGCVFDIPRFMLLGQRGGGKPIRVALMAGIEDEGALDGMAAISRLLVEMEQQPALAPDYAIFAYPLVNLFEYRRPESWIEPFHRRYAAGRHDGDVRFFRTELNKWRFDGIVTLRTDRGGNGFRAVVRSEVLAREVVRPAMELVERIAPLGGCAVRVRPGDLRTRLADHADGRLTPPPELRPHPFELELFASGLEPAEKRIECLTVAVHEVLRNYRLLQAHARDI